MKHLSGEPMKRPSRLRATAELSDSIHQQLNMYAVAAGAAGVSLLALAQPSEAKIVYTPSDTVIFFSYAGIPLDLNHDHVNDFTLHHYGESSFTAMFVGSYHHGSTNLVVAKPALPFGYWARALRAGVSIGPAITFAKQGIAWMGERHINGTTSQFSGPWDNGGKGVKNRYLGLKFVIRGKVHYGWARLTVTPTNGKFFTETLTGYAYETIPNKPIITGATTGPDDRNDVEPPNPAALTAPASKPATLGLLAMGAHGLSIWRREPLGALP
jgi:hypothetical protein